MLRDRHGWEKRVTVSVPLPRYILIPGGAKDRVFLRRGTTKHYREATA